MKTAPFIKGLIQFYIKFYPPIKNYIRKTKGVNRGWRELILKENCCVAEIKIDADGWIK
jgi:hypothetical protein